MYLSFGTLFFKKNLSPKKFLLARVRVITTTIIYTIYIIIFINKV